MILLLDILINSQFQKVNQCEKKDVEMETEEKEGLGEEKCLGSPSISG